MRCFFVRLKGYMKTILGMCATDGCHKQAVAEICMHFPSGNVKRCLCAERLESFIDVTNLKRNSNEYL